MGGLTAISHTEMGWWMQNNRCHLSRWEQGVIFGLDAVQLESISDDNFSCDQDHGSHISVFEKNPALQKMM